MLRRLLVPAVLASAVAIACAGPRAQPTRQTPPPKTSAAGSCATCHQVEAAEWAASLHHSAYTDHDFQASFRVEPLKFCFDCHAPEAKGMADVQGAAVGVGCASCHTASEGHVDKTTATTKTCASCHEFTFLGRSALMQSTVKEHAGSSFAGASCASCHLPRAPDGHRDHRFDVSRNVALLKASIDARSRRTDGGVEILLTSRNVGHAMPTGDLFRRLRVVVRSESTSGQPLGEEEVILARRFDRRGGAPVETDDTRVFGERSVRIEGAWLTAAARIHVEVRYERVAQANEIEDVRGERQHRDAVFASVLLVEHSLDANRVSRSRTEP